MVIFLYLSCLRSGAAIGQNSAVIKSTIDLSLFRLLRFFWVRIGNLVKTEALFNDYQKLTGSDALDIVLSEIFTSGET